MTTTKKLNQLIGAVLLLCALPIMFCSCEDEDTYAEMRKKESAQISNFITFGTKVVDKESGEITLEVKPIKVITESEFYYHLCHFMVVTENNFII